MMKVPLTDGQAGMLGELQTGPISPWPSLIFEVESGSLSYGFAAAKPNKENGFPCV